MFSSPQASIPLAPDITVVDDTPAEAWRIDDHFQPNRVETTWVDPPAGEPRLEETEADVAFYNRETVSDVTAWEPPPEIEGSIFLIAAALAIFGLSLGIALALFL